MNPCRICQSTENGYYKKSITCKKCTNRKTHEAKNKKAQALGFRNVTDKLKFEYFNSMMK